jgi:hypothetical protein
MGEFRECVCERFDGAIFDIVATHAIKLLSNIVTYIINNISVASCNFLTQKMDHKII